MAFYLLLRLVIYVPYVNEKQTVNYALEKYEEKSHMNICVMKNVKMVLYQ